VLEEADGVRRRCAFGSVGSRAGQFRMQFMLVGAVRNDGRDGAFGEPAADARSAVSLSRAGVSAYAFGQRRSSSGSKKQLSCRWPRNQHFQRSPLPSLGDGFSSPAAVERPSATSEPFLAPAAARPARMLEPSTHRCPSRSASSSSCRRSTARMRAKVPSCSQRRNGRRPTARAVAFRQIAPACARVQLPEHRVQQLAVQRHCRRDHRSPAK